MLSANAYKRVRGVSFAMACFVSLSAILGHSICATELAEDPIAFIGHGEMFDRNGNRIEPTPEFIAEVQTVYREFLSEQLPDPQRQLFTSKSARLFAGAAFDEQSRLVAHSSLIDWLIRNVDPDRVEDLHRLAGKNNYLKWLLRAELKPADQPSKGGETFKISELLKNRLDEAGLSEVASRSTTLSGAAYIDECRNAGVPIPPDWGSNQWLSKGILDNEFISGTSVAEIFVSQSTSPPGVSIALPRSIGNTIQLLGIISLGQTSGKVCYWDNQQNDLNFPIQKGTAVPLSQFAGGAELFEGSGGRCTGCHIGENPFVVHPGTNLGLPNLGGLPLFANNWHQPLVHPKWPQNRGPLVGTPGPCNGCHTAGGPGGRFPDLTSENKFEYCAAVLKPAIQRTMPPGSPGDPGFAQHAKALEALCDRPPGPDDAGIAALLQLLLMPLR